MESLNLNDDFIEHGGGRAGAHELDFLEAGHELDEIDSLRQELLSQNDVGKVQRALRKLGIRVQPNIIQAVKNYIFDSQGIAFTYENYAAWRRLVTGKGVIGDAAFLVHEMAEVKELQRIQRETGFDFMGRKAFDSTYPRSRRERKRWQSDFKRYYRQAHSKALEVEYRFIASQVETVTNGVIKISFLQAAAIDPTRRIKRGLKETEAALYLLVDGAPMQEHHHFEGWLQRANEMVALNKKTQRRLRYYLRNTTLSYLIELVKSMPIK